MDATTTQRLTQAVLVTAEDLHTFSRALTPRLPPPSAVAECADGLGRRFSSIEELVAFDNAPSRAVRALTLESRTPDYSCSLSLTLETDTSSNVRYSIRGSEETVLALRSAVDAFLSGIRPSYWRLSRIDSMAVMPAVFLVAASLWFLLVVRTNPFASGSSAPSFSTSAVLAALSLLPIVLSKSLDRVVSYLFPMCVFSWQQGRKHADHLSFIRTVVVVGLVISIAGSVIAGFLVSP